MSPARPRPSVAAGDADLRPVVLGYDAVSPLGTDLETQWRRAEAGQSGIGPLSRFPLREGFPVRIAGEVEPIETGGFEFLSPRKMAHWTSPVFRHGMLVVQRALSRIGLSITAEIAPRVAVTFSSAIGGLDAVLAADRELVASGRLPHPFMNSNSCINMVGGKVSMLTGATGPIVSTVTACATGSTSLIVGAMFLQAGLADVALCGAVDFPLVEPIVAGFATMNGAYKSKPGENEPPWRASRPFARDRRGFVVSEGAACIVISTLAFARAHGLACAIELAGWASTADAHHFVAPHPPTVLRCMAEALAHAGVEPQEIDAVNVHAASTQVGDRVEHETLGELFGGRIPPLGANKSLLGHAMGASSAIECVLAMEGMRRGILLPTINYTPDPELPLEGLSGEAVPLEQEHVLKNAFGFGGCNACIVLRHLS